MGVRPQFGHSAGQNGQKTALVDVIHLRDSERFVVVLGQQAATFLAQVMAWQAGSGQLQQLQQQHPNDLMLHSILLRLGGRAQVSCSGS